MIMGSNKDSDMNNDNNDNKDTPPSRGPTRP